MEGIEINYFFVSETLPEIARAASGKLSGGHFVQQFDRNMVLMVSKAVFRTGY